jgi:hypothetical protein
VAGVPYGVVPVVGLPINRQKRNFFRVMLPAANKGEGPRNRRLRRSLYLDRSHSSPPLRFNLFGKVANLLVTNGSNTRY